MANTVMNILRFLRAVVSLFRREGGGMKNTFEHTKQGLMRLVGKRAPRRSVWTAASWSGDVSPLYYSCGRGRQRTLKEVQIFLLGDLRGFSLPVRFRSSREVGVFGLMRRRYLQERRLERGCNKTASTARGSFAKNNVRLICSSHH